MKALVCELVQDVANNEMKRKLCSLEYAFDFFFCFGHREWLFRFYQRKFEEPLPNVATSSASNEYHSVSCARIYIS